MLLSIRSGVYEWVDVLGMDPNLDPSLVGETLAAIHQVHYAPARPLIGWYTDPVGAPRWAELLQDSKAAGAPFADALDAEISELLRLEALIEPPTNLQNCHRDLVGRQHPADADRRGLRDRLGELWIGGSGAGTADGHDRLCVR